MGRLSDFDAYLQDRISVVQQAEKKLCALQAKYESFFSEVSAVRESELGQLSGHIAAGRDKLPPSLVQALDAAQVQVEKELDLTLKKLAEERDAARDGAEKLRQESLTDEEGVHKKNVDLDAREEALKTKSADLLARIDSYNAHIREMAGGFGFFKNFFAMRALGAERAKLDEEQATTAALIDQLRTAWVGRESTFAEAEGVRQKDWATWRTKESAVQAKIDALRESRPTLVFRTVAERVLFERRPKLPIPAASDPKCTRCGSANPPSSFFCQICAFRLQPDRPDLEGSLLEIAEVNLHYARFADGMKSCQQIIGLARGLESGLSSFRKSVQSMIDSQSKYPLAKLQLDVPAQCVQWGALLEQLRDAVQPNLSMHPQEFAERMKAWVEKLSADAIKAWFEGMGEELSRTAKSQWG